MCDCRLKTDYKQSYDNQETWKNYRDYYSVYKTPININTSKVLVDTNQLKINWSSTQLTHSEPTTKFVQYTCLDNSSYVLYNENRYNLLQFHFHNSSENTKDGVYYPVEVHFVHYYKNSDNI